MTDAFGRPTDPAGRDVEHGEQAASGTRRAAMRDAATNLLHKAVRALEAADRSKAMAYVRKAAKLADDDDDNGGAAPLTLAAHLYALESVLDVLELADDVWIDAAEGLLESTRAWTPLAVADFRHVLTVARKEYRLTPAHDRRLAALVAGERVATIREMQELGGEELCAVVIDLLDLVGKYRHAAETIVAERAVDDYRRDGSAK